MLDGMPTRTWSAPMVAGLTAMLALGLAGCAGRATPPYSDAERTRLDEYDRAAERVMKSRELTGRPPMVRTGTDPALETAGHPAAYYERSARQAAAGRPGTIVVNRSALADDYIAQSVLSHELAHFVLGHTEEGCRERQHDCEVEAYVASVELLMTGWGHGYADAVRLQYAYLKSVVLAVQRGEATVARGHGDPCRELQDFSTRFQTSATCD
jgi:hypothetical protein